MFQPGSDAPQDRSGALHFVFQQGELICDFRSHEPCFITDAQIEEHGWQIEREQFLGTWHGRACFAVEIDDISAPDPMQFERGSLWHLLGRVEEPLFALAGRAAQMLAWERDHQFCGRCGRRMQLDRAERAMHCQQCDLRQYPRIAPCVIVLVHRGDELLLARHTRFRRPMYSTLAGFIEAGESAEDTLHREVAEEVGLTVANIRYYDSQSWPFPNQLMLGYYAEYAGGEIRPEEAEIMDARWFHYSQLPPVPPETSIAGRLIHDFVRDAAQAGGTF